MKILKKIKVFTDYVCPWCYLGHSRVKKLMKNLDFNVEIIHYPLHPNTPNKGLKLIELFNCSEKELEFKNENMAALMKNEDIKFNYRTHTYNSRLAQEIGVWGYEVYNNFDIHDRFYEAYFIENKNLNDKNILIEVIEKSGLNIIEGEKVINKRLFKNKVDEHWSQSYQYRVTGVPTYVLNNRTLVGAQSYEVLEKFINVN